MALSTNSTPAEYSQPIIPETEKTKAFRVNGSAIPDVDFDAGESYAGLLPISNDTNSNSSELFFWFYPSPNPEADDEILIWLNGGPGCSSLEGILQENGPFLWQYGTYRPVKNPYSMIVISPSARHRTPLMKSSMGEPYECCLDRATCGNWFQSSKGDSSCYRRDRSRCPVSRILEELCRYLWFAQPQGLYHWRVVCWILCSVYHGCYAQ